MLPRAEVDLGLKGSVSNDTRCVLTQMTLAGLRRSLLVSALRMTLHTRRSGFSSGLQQELMGQKSG